MPLAPLDQVSINHLQLGAESSEAGRAPLVFVHGLATSLAFWMPTVQHLAEDRPMVLFDLRGHGRSTMPAGGYTPARMADDLEDLLDRLRIPSAVVVGHSFGGSVALHFACRRPERVSRLILADARLRLLQPRQSPSDWPHWATLQERLERLGIVVGEDEPEGGYRILTEMARLQVRAIDTQETIPRWLAGFYGGGTSTYAAARWLELLETTSAWRDITGPESISEEDLRGLEMPTLAVYGEISPVLPTAEALRALWPRLVFRSVPGAGHFFPLSQAALFAGLMHEFLEGP